jgi:hypothetical protein
LFVKRTRDNHLQRAEGCGRMVLGSAQSGARIVELFQRSPIRILFPRVGDGALEEAVLINTAGGIAGGDRLESSVTALAKASTGRSRSAATTISRKPTRRSLSIGRPHSGIASTFPRGRPCASNRASRAMSLSSPTAVTAWFKASTRPL